MRMLRRIVVIVSCVMAVVGTPKAVLGQEVVASSLDQLRLAVRPGDKITVTDTQGRETTGKLAELSPTGLTLAKEGRTFAEADIKTIRRHDHRSIRTGAFWGLGVGAGIGFVYAYGVCGLESSDCGVPGIAGAALFGGLGAGVGSAIAAAIPKHRLVYAHAGSSVRLTIAPTFTRNTRGIAFGISH